MKVEPHLRDHFANPAQGLGSRYGFYDTCSHLIAPTLCFIEPEYIDLGEAFTIKTLDEIVGETCPIDNGQSPGRFRNLF